MTPAAPAPTVYGCHNRKPFVQVVTLTNGEQIPQRMKKDCQYTETDMGKVDRRCARCSWKLL